MNASKRVLVTGGAGFLGSHLCSVLLEKSYHVIAIDNLYTGRFYNIKTLLDNDNFMFIKHDVIKPIDLSVDFIFNGFMASIKSFKLSATFADLSYV